MIRNEEALLKLQERSTGFFCDTFNDREDGGKALFKSPYSVHEYFLEMSELFDLIDTWRQELDLSQVEMQDFYLKKFQALARILVNIASMSELTQAFKHTSNILTSGKKFIQMYMMMIDKHA